MKHLQPRISKLAYIALIPPVAFLLLFLLGEVFGGDLSGFGHLIQLVPLLLLAYLATIYPKVIGWLLVIVGTLAVYLYTIRSGFPIATTMVVDLVLFLPLVVSGYFFISSSPSK